MLRQNGFVRSCITGQGQAGCAVVTVLGDMIWD